VGLRRWSSRAAVLATIGLVLAVAGSFAVSSTTLALRAQPPRTVAPERPGLTLGGPLAARSGPYLTDRYGRVVFLHGVNAVYKRPPFELYPDPRHPWSFTAADASKIAELGFDVVRLGVLWQGLAPSDKGPNSPSVCRRGPPRAPHPLLDMHQDLYSSAFGGEGAPPWAVCTDGLRIVRPPGRWSRTYSTSTLDIAEAHFWTNDVVGNLQGDYLEAWRAVARYFAKNPWVVGYDMINEPYTLRLSPGDPEVATQLECFYTGRGQPGLDQAFGLRLHCAPDVPREGLVPTLQSVSPHRLLFFEPDIYGRKLVRNTVGPIDDPNLVYNFHSYCPFRDPVTGNPTNVGGCTDRQISTIRRRQADRATDFTSAQPRGPAWFMSEFGATDNGDLVAALVAAADRYRLGWSYWAWKYYRDPTGSSAEGLVEPTGRFSPAASALAEVYPEAVAGAPRSFGYDPLTNSFSLVYTPERTRAPTLVEVPTRVHYPRGYCATATGGRVVSAPDATRLLVANGQGRRVSISIQPGPCPR
jgi:endoglycosylceramidase